ncbi:hypothetical protein ACLMJK_005938 [Lecanora helva]
MLNVQKKNVRALITITSDLGDDFYPGSLNLYAKAVALGERGNWQSDWNRIEWKAGMRTVWIEIQNLSHNPSQLLELIVNSQPALEADEVSFTIMPEVLSARSESFGREKCHTSKRIQRRYRTGCGQERMIYEDTGESIARHIWDAGITLIAYLNHVTSQREQISSLGRVLSESRVHNNKFIELGSGCGIVGLELAHLCPASDVFLTDLPDAMEILNYNISKARFSSRRGQVISAALDWEKPLFNDIWTAKHDLIVVSDCTYNSDSIPALVKTLSMLIEISPTALIVVSMKVRHESEGIFFDLIANAGLIEADRVTIPLPDRQRESVGQSLVPVDIYTYGKDAGS